MNWIAPILRRLGVRPNRKSSLTPNSARPTRRLHLEELEPREVPAVITEFAIPTSIARPTGITSGPDGAIWFSEGNGNKIGRITSAGTITEFDLPANTGPGAITTGPDGALWFTGGGNNTIGLITTSGTITEFTIPTGSSSPSGITTGPDGALWFTEQSGNKIGRITTSGTFTEYGAGVVGSPFEIVVGSDGNLWFTEINDDKLGMIVPSGVNAGSITLYDLAPGSSPRGITPGSDGNLWFAESGSDIIGRITTAGVISEFGVPTPNSYSSEITSGPGGDLYFCEGAANKIGRITTDGVIVGEYDIPTAEAGPNGITFGADGSIWFGEYIGNNISKLSVGPTATNDSYTAIQNTPLTKNVASGVLANDSGTGTLTASVVTNPAHGTLTLNADGSFTYAPDLNYHGPDSFTYKTNDGIADSNTATVNIAVDAPPVAVTDSYTTVRNTPLARNAAQGVLANDTDADGNPIIASQITGTAHGILSLNADGSFTYIPDFNYHGPDSFTYQAGDGFASSNTVTVNIFVDAPPVAVADSYTTDAGTGLPVTIPLNGVLANDTDADGDPLTAIAVTQPANGTLFLFASGLNADGTFTYYPNIGFVGTDSFTYKVNDGTTDSNTVTVTITVNARPVATNDSYTAIQNTPLTRNAIQGVLFNDTGTSPVTASVVTNPAHGTLTLNADGSFTYTPTAGYHGPDSFTYKANDGIADSNTATVNIAVDAPPAAVNDSYKTVRNTPLTRNAAQGVLSNDTDAEGDPFTASVVTNPAHGTLSLAADGSFTYTPDAGYSGPDSFTYKANDGTADGNTVTVAIAVDTPPVAVADGYTVVESTTLTKSAASGVLSNDTDADGDPLTAVLVAGPVHGTLTLASDGSFTYTPNRGYLGSDSFTYKANDGGADGNTVTVTVEVQPVVSDVNGDGRADIIVGTATGSSHIKVYSETDGSLLLSFFAFDGYNGGVASAGGDTNDDGHTDVIAGSATTGSHVKVFDGTTGAVLHSFLAFQGYDGGVVVASGDVNGDGFADIIVGTRTGSSHVKVFSGADGSEIRSYMAFAGYLGGVVVAAGDLNGDGFADIIVGAATGSSHVKAFSGADGSEIRSFLALPGFTGDLSIAVADADGDGVPDIIAGSKVGTSRVTSVNGTSLNPTDSFLAFDDFLGGVEVG